MVELLKMTRGYVAKHLKINPETLRYYETQKLIKKPKRLENNYRVYDLEDVERVQFIIKAKELGFTLKEIKELLQLSLTEKSDRSKVRAMAKHKSKIIDDKINQLMKIKKILDDLVNACLHSEHNDHCPILKSFSKV